MKKFPVGFHFIIKRTGNGILTEIWQDTGDNGDKPGQNWKKVRSWVENPNYNRPKWVDTLEEYLAIPENERKNVHIKSKPSTGPTFINEKGEICFRMYDEYDHVTTVRCDNPFNLTAEETKEVMRDLTKGFRKGNKDAQ